MFTQAARDSKTEIWDAVKNLGGLPNSMYVFIGVLKRNRGAFTFV